MSERPTPDLDRIREALREHDENAEEIAREREPEPEERPAPEPEQDDDAE